MEDLVDGGGSHGVRVRGQQGLSVQVDGQVAVIEGVKELHPAPLRATDLRAGAAMVMAALAANGVSEVDETIHIERGYENIVEKLQALGADIRAVEEPDEDALSTAQIS